LGDGAPWWERVNKNPAKERAAIQKSTRYQKEDHVALTIDTWKGGVNHNALFGTNDNPRLTVEVVGYGETQKKEVPGGRGVWGMGGSQKRGADVEGYAMGRGGVHRVSKKSKRSVGGRVEKTSAK